MYVRLITKKEKIMRNEKLYTERQSVISELTDIAQKLESRPNSGDTVEKAYELAVQVLKGKHDKSSATNTRSTHSRKPRVQLVQLQW